MLRSRQVLLTGLVVVLLGAFALAQEAKVLDDFENEADLARAGITVPGQLTTEHATHGAHAVKLKGGEGISATGFDFTGARNYDWLAFDVFNPQDGPQGMLIVIRDQIGEEEGYWGRYNGYLTLRPGMNHVKLPINNLYRGEKGSQPMKDKGPVVAEKIRQVAILPGYGEKPPGVFYLDYIRLEKEERAAEVPGMRRFDFGPPTQTVFPGFTPVTYNTTYTKQQGFGLHHAQWVNAARDDQFPNSLYADYCEVLDNPFTVDLPNGEYTVQVVYDDTGYWGGEFKPFHQRSIVAEGRTFCLERSTDEEALARYCHFQDTEPLPGQDIYQTYVGHRFQPRVFSVRVTDGQLDLTFKADAAMVAKVASIVIYPADRKAQGEAWLADLAKRLRTEWESLWVYADPRNPNADAKLPSSATAGDYVLFVPALEANVNFAYTPTAAELKKEIVAAAARGEYEPLLVGVRPLVDLGPVKVEVSDLTSDSGRIPAGAVEVRVVRHLTSRRGESRFTIAPAALLPFESVDLKKELTREFWLTVHVPEDAKPGEYTGRVTLRFADGKSEAVPVTLTVYPFTLEEADFAFGLFWISPNLGEVYGPGTEPYWEAQEQLLRMLREHGFTSFTGSPLPTITGVDNGEVVLDFTEFDRFWKLALSVGFRRDYQSYGRGVRNLNKATAQQYGVSYEQLIRSTFAQLREHSKAMGVPEMTYSLCDEPRTEDQYRTLFAELAIWQQAAPWAMAGYISLTKEQLAKPDDPHRKIFDTLTVPIVNLHDAGVLEYARKQGKRVDIYNQGNSRFSFGLYQWREKLAGVGGRWQWIMNIAHGDPYYDLDGREPDPCFVYFRTDGLAPAVRMAVAREGIDDLRYITTAIAMAKKAQAAGNAQAKAAAKSALARIDQAMGKLQVGQRRSTAVNLEEFRAALAHDIAEMGQLRSLR